MTEQELIDTINALIDADVQSECPLRPKDIARRASIGGGEGVYTTKAVANLVGQVLSIRVEPWKWPPGARPRLRALGGGVTRLAPKLSVAEILEAGRQAGEPMAVILARVRRAHPRLTEAALDAEVESYTAWVEDCGNQMMREMGRLTARIERNSAGKRELERAPEEPGL